MLFRTLRYFPFLLLALLLACGKIELESEVPDNKGNNDKGNDKTEQQNGDVYSVATLSQATEDSLVQVKGYIVGYIKGTTIKNAQFTAEDAVASNLIIADAVSETDYTNCAAIQLKNNTHVREAFNLQDNPQQLHALVLFTGYKVAQYCYSVGLKPAIDAELVSDDEDNGDDGKDPEEPIPDADAFPTLNTEESDVFEGA